MMMMMMMMMMMQQQQQHAHVGECHAVELAHAVVALQHHAGVLPGDGAASLNLRIDNKEQRSYV
jgi:hypothetical protein